MSDSVIFDTNLHIKRITKTGVSQDTAEAFVETVAHVLAHNLATKTDIAGIQKDIASLQKDTTTATDSLRKDTTALVLEAKNELISSSNRFPNGLHQAQDTIIRIKQPARPLTK